MPYLQTSPEIHRTATEAAQMRAAKIRTDLATARANKICANNPEVVSRYAIVAEIEQILAAETAAFQRGEFLAGLSLHVIRQRLTTLIGPAV